MADLLVEQLSRGSFCFLRPSAEELRRLFGAAEESLPRPQRIHFADEAATPLVGYPLLRSAGLVAFEEAFDEYILAEEEAQLAVHLNRSFDSRTHGGRWERYRTALRQITENAIRASHGRGYASLFWLYHSAQVSRRLRDLPKRLVRHDLRAGREHGDALKYRVCFKLLDRVVNLTFDVAHQLAGELDADEDAIFPSLLGVMRDNVLILSEDHVSPDLSELSSYFHGCLGIDGRELRQRLAALEEWQAATAASDSTLRGAIVHLLGEEGPLDRRIFSRPGYLRFLARHPRYDATRLPTPEHVEVWESLLAKLQEFEVLQALRKMVVMVDADDEAYRVSAERRLDATWVGTAPVQRLATTVRPLDFAAPGVVDPLVSRHGLVYDITDFSATLSMLGRAERGAMEHAFRTTLVFQRRINRLATNLHLRLEKYLGDGAFYSGRSARALVILAVAAQRAYRQALADGFPFDRGLRVALNYGEYRLIPLDAGHDSRGPLYEFFGQGLVELSRLSTGKKTQEIEELQNYLIGQGYPAGAVHKFFAPLLRRDAELVSKHEEAREFYAYINANGTLINEGMVATEAFVAHLGGFDEMSYTRQHGRGYIVVAMPHDGGGEPTRVGLRKLGLGKFKGIDSLPIYELVDVAGWDLGDAKRLQAQELLPTLERLFASSLNRRRGGDATDPIE